MTAEEREIEEGIRHGEWVPLEGEEFTRAKNEAEAAVRANIEARANKEARTNIRLEQADMDALKRVAQKRGIGYQTLIASVIHMYVNDELLEMGEVKKLARMGLLKNKAG